MNERKILRCAIYTRKSTEEGLQQEFNSLHAQREACEAYIKSQAHEGWTLVRTAYDDGGYSGATMERPALKRLMEEIRNRRIDTIVVYKVDRLTRSLADFAKIVETLDGASASFVSVTQSFNTTTSMGRLTLNVLLSFAQFEREVTGERIRDKIAASKRRGLWMGGIPPLGYDLRDRRLVLNKAEANQVRTIFAQYLDLGTVPALVKGLSARNIRSKAWISESGRRIGGCVLRRGAVYCMLRNRTYRGEIAHKGNIYRGEHSPVVDSETWDRVQALLDGRNRSGGRRSTGSGALLAGLLYDDRGNRMTPTHATKRGGRRYRYYVSRAILENRPGEAGTIAHVSAGPLERIVIEEVAQRLPAGGRDQARTDPRTSIQANVSRVDVGTRRITIGLLHPLPNTESGKEKTIVADAPFLVNRSSSLVGKVPTDSMARGNTGLVRALARASAWRKEVEAGIATSPEHLARLHKCTRRYARAMLELAFLAPDLVELCLAGKQLPTLNSSGVIERARRPVTNVCKSAAYAAAV